MLQFRNMRFYYLPFFLDKTRNSNISHLQLAFNVSSSGTLICFDFTCCRPNSNFLSPTYCYVFWRTTGSIIWEKQKINRSGTITSVFILYLSEFKSFAPPLICCYKKLQFASVVQTFQVFCLLLMNKRTQKEIGQIVAIQHPTFDCGQDQMPKGGYKDSGQSYRLSSQICSTSLQTFKRDHVDFYLCFSLSFFKNVIYE